MTVLVVSTSGDSHAAVVCAALSHIEVRNILVDQASLVGRGDMSWSSQASCEDLCLGGIRFSISDIKAFWNRRDPQILKMPEDVHPADETEILFSHISFMDGIRGRLDQGFSVNPASSVRHCASKINQISAARGLGFITPDTLISDCYDEVISFIAARGRVCIKPFRVHDWVAEEGVVSMMSVMASQEHLPERRSVELSPLIYQEWIEKTCEIRLTAFGEFACATKISYGRGVSQIDWRRNTQYLRNLKPVAIPNKIRRSISKLLKALRLRFGVFDFIVRPDGEWVFLEVNQAGAFLWQEEFCGSSIVLEPFARFLASGDDGFDWDPRQATPGFDIQSMIALSRNLFGKYLASAPIDGIKEGLVSNEIV